MAAVADCGATGSGVAGQRAGDRAMKGSRGRSRAEEAPVVGGSEGAPTPCRNINLQKLKIYEQFIKYPSIKTKITFGFKIKDCYN